MSAPEAEVKRPLVALCRQVVAVLDCTKWGRVGLASFAGLSQVQTIITDSQAMDIMKTWAPEDIPLTTFSIMMINYMSRGRINDFASAVKSVNSLRPGDRILIAER